MPAVKEGFHAVFPRKPEREVKGAEVKVRKGKSSEVTKEAVKSNADRYRDAMIRLANR